MLKTRTCRRGKRERILHRFKSAEHAQRFLVPFSAVSNHFRPRRHRLTASTYRQFRTQAHTAELERRRQVLDPQVPQLVLVVSELAQDAGEEDLRFLLTHRSEFRVRVVAATADTVLERDLLVDLFETRLVFALEDEEASTRLLGKPWALTLAEPGRLLARGSAEEVQILGLHGARVMITDRSNPRGARKSISSTLASWRRLAAFSRRARRRLSRAWQGLSTKLEALINVGSRAVPTHGPARGKHMRSSPISRARDRERAARLLRGGQAPK